MKNNRKPRIAFVMGDPSGIGPELTLKLLSEPETIAAADIVVVAGRQVYSAGENIVGTPVPCHVTEEVTEETFADHGLVLLSEQSIDNGEYVPGEASKRSGRYQLDCLATALNLCRDNLVDGVCFAPLKKEVGDKAYYQCIGGHGVEHANEITEKGKQVAFYKELKMVADATKDMA